MFGFGKKQETQTVYRQKSGRYGKPGQYRKERNGDRVSRGSDGRYKRKGLFG